LLAHTVSGNLAADSIAFVMPVSWLRTTGTQVAQLVAQLVEHRALQSTEQRRSTEHRERESTPAPGQDLALDLGAPVEGDRRPPIVEQRPPHAVCGDQRHRAQLRALRRVGAHSTRDVGEPKFATRQEHVKTMHNPPL
jgi:hypothetical protein